MKVKIDETELYPFYEEETNPNEYSDHEIELSEFYYKEWKYHKDMLLQYQEIIRNEIDDQRKYSL